MGVRVLAWASARCRHRHDESYRLRDIPLKRAMSARLSRRIVLRLGRASAKCPSREIYRLLGYSLSFCVLDACVCVCEIFLSSEILSASQLQRIVLCLACLP